MLTKFSIFLIFLILIKINGQLISFDIEPRIFNIQQHYEQGLVSLSIDPITLCSSQVTITECAKYIVLNMVLNDESGGINNRMISSFNLLGNSTTTSLNYQFDIFPRDISGKSSVTISIAIDGVQNSTISPSDITAKGFNPFITVHKPDEQVHILDFSFPDQVDFTDYLNPMIFELSVACEILINNAWITIIPPNGGQKVSISLTDSNIVFHQDMITNYRGYNNFFNVPGTYHIESIGISLSNGAAKAFDTLDLESLEWPISFQNKPNTTPNYPLPTSQNLEYYFSTQSIPLSWSTQKPMFANLNILNFNGPLDGVMLKLEPLDNSTDTFYAQFKRFAIPESNDGVSFSFDIDATVEANYNCTFLIYNPYFEYIQLSCGMVSVYRPYYFDTTPPTASITPNPVNPQLISITTSDAESGISKIVVNFGFFGNEQEYLVNQRLSGTPQNAEFQVLLGKSVSLAQVPIRVFDYNHNFFDVFYDYTPSPADEMLPYHPSIAYNPPSTIDLTTPQTQEVFINFIDSTCQFESHLLYQSPKLITSQLSTTLSNFYDLVSGTACDGVVGRTFVYPEYHRVQGVSSILMPFSGNESGPNQMYSTVVNYDQNYLDYEPIMLEGVEILNNQYNISSGTSITISVQLTSGVRLYEVSVFLVGLNQQFTFPLKNTFGTYYDGTWSAPVTIPIYANEGNWTINVYTFSYLGERNFTYDNIFMKGYECFLTIRSQVDVTPPVVNALSQSDWTSLNQISISVTDDKSGIQSVEMILTPDNQTEIVNPLQYFRSIQTYPQNGTLAAIVNCNFVLPQYFFGGDFWIYVIVSDFSGNTKLVTPDSLAAAGFTPTFVQIVSPNSGDAVAPTLVSLSASSNSVTSFPQTITISAQIADDASGINSLTIYLNTSTNIYKYVNLQYADRVSGNTLLANFQAQFTFNAGIAQNTKFYASVVNVQDNNGNIISYPPTFIPTVITINAASTLDKILPEVQSVSLSQSLIDLAVNPPTSVTVTATINDNSALQDNPVVWIQHSTQNFIPIIECQVASQNGMVYTYTCVTEDYPTGLYYIHVKSVSDVNGNYNSCFKCQTLTIIDSANPLFVSFTPVPTTGGTAYFTVENFIDAPQTKIQVDGVNCQDLTFVNSNLISCTIGNGTGIVDVIGTSNNKNTNIVVYSYQIPSIESTTSVLPIGGNVAIQGSNFGVSTNSQMISILIGGVICTPLFVNHTDILCNLKATESSNVLKNVVVTVDGLSSVDGINKFAYNDPPTTPCSSPTCSGHGTCLAGTCYCTGRWSGETCNQQTIDSPTNPNTTSPGIIITPNSTNEDISTLMAISIAGFNEIGVDGSVVTANIFTNWTYTQSSSDVSDNFFYTSKISPSSNITVLLQVFKIETIVKFAGQDDTLPPNGLKYSVNITNYPWKSQLNTGQLIIKSELATQVQDETFCSGFNQTQIGEGTGADDIRWIKISQGNYTVYGKFGNRAMVDGRQVLINNVVTGGDITLGGNITSSSLVGVNVPHFYKIVEIDPNFSVLLNPDYQSESESQHLCEKKKERKWLIPVVCTIAGVVAICLVVVGIWYYKKRKLDKMLKNSLSRST
ncbi:hypothetical protein DLAC_05592 [Tieghemostelium lacteum]|uniref:Uncharacterized protein n=1 Tax=Tieghemostelium lacteum TaxID=361077 RepID=A0A151ZG86_TIELA|nr:hypothetical protein DLAC_05592 [Tieghemostelium lacteum]|eukprot:KYQ92988.1 hypothetical protein DLAC_05592 [Tieghemostelium lacteum]